MSFRFVRGCVLTCLLLVAPLAFGQANIPPTASLQLPAKAKPGEKVSGNVLITFASGLHGYQNPPTESYMIPVSVSASGPISLKDVKYPKGVDEIVGGSTTPVRVYEGTIKIAVSLVTPTKPGTYDISLTVNYQQCNANNCFAPSSVQTSGKLTVEAPATTTSSPPKTTKTKGSVDTSKGGKPEKATPDKTKSGTPLKTTPATDNAKTPYTAKNGKQQPPKDEQVTKPEKSADNKQQVGQPATNSSSNPSTNNTSKTSSKPVPPITELPVSSNSTGTVENSNKTTTTSPSPTTGSTETETSSSAAFVGDSSDGFIATNLRNAFQHGNYLFVVLLALLTGLALAVTPCVYPMIPITVGFFSNQTAGNRMARVGLGLMYMLGLAVTYGVVGGISAALGGSIGSLFQATWFLFALGVLMAVLALSMFDVYEIRLPSFLSRQIKGRSGAVGALIMGLLMGFAAAPCAGPVVTVYAVKVAEFRNLPLGLLLFTSIGIGLGLPFFALGALSTGAKTLPRSGGWLKTLKSLLGIIVLYVALNYFLQAFQVRSDGSLGLLIKAIFLIAAAGYLFLFEKSDSTRVILGLKGGAILLCGLLAGQLLEQRMTPAMINWVPFTQESFAAAKASGKPIVIDASADWCALCHDIDDAVFKNQEGAADMQGVVALRIDQSAGVDPKYVQMTNQMFGIKGLPHVEFFKPGGQSVAVVTGLDQLNTPAKLKAYLKLASGS